MRMLKPIIVVLLVLSMTTFAGVATSQERGAPQALDLTMVLLPEGARSGESITRRIELPPAAAAGTESRRGENERPGGADEPQARGPEEAPERAARGLETAEQARELGREFGQQIADQARENRENAARGEQRETRGPPDIDVPGSPNRPNPPGPPGQ